MEIFGLGTPEILLVVFVLLLFFGKDKLPEMTRSIGHSFRELKNGFSEGIKEDEKKKDAGKKA